MLLRLSPGRILYLNAVARVTICRASALLPSGFSRTNLYCCRRISQRRISSWLASRRSRSRPPHAYKWRPCPCIGQWIRLQDLINPASLSPSREDPNDEHPEDALPAHPHVRWRRMLFNHLKYSMVLQVGMHVATSPTEVCDVLLGTRGVSLDRFFRHWKNRELKLKYFRKPFDNNKHHMSPGGARKGWASPGYLGADSAI